MSDDGLPLYSCRSGSICKRNPSCVGGVCQLRVDVEEQKRRGGITGYDCCVGVCPLGTKCERAAQCVWEQAAYLDPAAADAVLRHVGYIKGVPQHFATHYWRNYHAEAAAAASWSRVTEPSFTANFDTTELRNTMDQRKHDLSGSPMGFMWGVPFEVGIDLARDWDVTGDAMRSTTSLPPVTAGDFVLQREGGRAGSCGSGLGGYQGRGTAEAPSKLRQPLELLSQDSQERKDTPICTGVLDYFPRALAYVAKVSKVNNDKHNPGEPLHWSKHKSTDHADCVMRHLAERGTVAPDGLRHSGMLAWRALALLEMELEADAMGYTVEELIDGYKAEAE